MTQLWIQPVSSMKLFEGPASFTASARTNSTNNNKKRVPPQSRRHPQQPLNQKKTYFSNLSIQAITSLHLPDENNQLIIANGTIKSEIPITYFPFSIKLSPIHKPSTHTQVSTKRIAIFPIIAFVSFIVVMIK